MDNEKKRRGPGKAEKKVSVTIRLDAEVVEYLRLKYPKWQTESNRVLAERVFLEKERERREDALAAGRAVPFGYEW